LLDDLRALVEFAHAGPSPVQPIVYFGRPLRLPREGSPSVWLRVRGSHDVQSSPSTDAHQQDGYPDATDSRCPLSTNSTLQPCFCPKVKPRLHLFWRISSLATAWRSFKAPQATTIKRTLCWSHTARTAL